MVAINNAQRLRCPNRPGGVDYEMWVPASGVPENATDCGLVARSGSYGAMWFVSFATIALLGLISAVCAFTLMLLAAWCVLE